MHDIEDLASEGARIGGCPYFAAREFARDAELIFCPYSYLVSPRETVQAFRCLAAAIPHHCMRFV